MKENIQKQHILQFIQTTMATLDLMIDIQEESSGVNMSYNFIKNCVGIDYERVQDALTELTHPVPLETYIKVFTMHELGHAMDRDALMDSLPRTIDIFKMKREHSLYEIYNDIDLLSMMIEEHQMNLVFEETAWENAAQMNQKHQLVDWHTFELLKQHSLATYINLHERDLALYEQLAEEKNLQIA